MSGDPPSPDTPDEGIPQDPAIPGVDAVSEPLKTPIPDEKDEDAERRERADDPDEEGHMTAGGG